MSDGRLQLIRFDVVKVRQYKVAVRQLLSTRSTQNDQLNGKGWLGVRKKIWIAALYSVLERVKGDRSNLKQLRSRPMHVRKRATKVW